jgi:hypothetical protein
MLPGIGGGGGESVFRDGILSEISLGHIVVHPVGRIIAHDAVAGFAAYRGMIGEEAVHHAVIAQLG